MALCLTWCTTLWQGFWMIQGLRGRWRRSGLATHGRCCAWSTSRRTPHHRRLRDRKHWMEELWSGILGGWWDLLNHGNLQHAGQLSQVQSVVLFEGGEVPFQPNVSHISATSATSWPHVSQMSAIFQPLISYMLATIWPHTNFINIENVNKFVNINRKCNFVQVI